MAQSRWRPPAITIRLNHAHQPGHDAPSSCSRRWRGLSPGFGLSLVVWLLWTVVRITLLDQLKCGSSAGLSSVKRSSASSSCSSSDVSVSIGSSPGLVMRISFPNSTKLSTRGCRGSEALSNRSGYTLFASGLSAKWLGGSTRCRPATAHSDSG